MEEDVLIYDIETSNKTGDVNDNELKVFGAYSYKTNKHYIIPYTDKEFIQKLVDEHRILVGFNNIEFDNPIIEKFGVKLDYKLFVDCYDIIKKRAGSMTTKKGMLGLELMSYSLDYITRFLDLVTDEEAKDKIDYNIFNKNTWTPEERKKIIKYTKRDIEITKKLYEWLEKYFEAFKDFVSEDDVKKKKYLTDTMAKFGYKADCYALDLEPIYNKDNNERVKIEGGYVSYPADKEFHAKQNITDKKISFYDLIIANDYSSLYPHIMIQANLHSRNKDNTGWHGGKLFQVEAYYNNEELGLMGKLLRKWYFLRMSYKRKGLLEDGTIFSYKNAKDFKGKKYYHVSEEKGKFELELLMIDDDTIEKMKTLFEQGVDRKEYTIKILLNLQYGILNHPYYQLVYDPIAGADCTRIGRQSIKYARKVFRDAAYKIVYTDTDSWYFIDVFNDKQKYIDLKNKVIKDIKDSLPFPQLTFDAETEAEIKHMYFFKGHNNEEKESDKEMDEDDFINKPKGLMKKNYIYITTDNKLVLKNLGIKKKNVSALSKKIFWDYMTNKFKQGIGSFSRSEIENVMLEFLEKDLTLAYMRKNIRPLHMYKKSLTSIQAQISEKYGAGIFFLIPNKRGIGVGKGVKYCTIQEFKDYKMGLSDIDLTNFWKELNYFIKERKKITLFDV